MWILLALITFGCFSTIQAGGNCISVLDECLQNDHEWTRCYEDRIATCILGRRPLPNFYRMMVNSLKEVEMGPTDSHKVHIPSSALQRSRTAKDTDNVLVVITVINSAYFKVGSPQSKGRTALKPNQTEQSQHSLLGQTVLVVKAGSQDVNSLEEPIKIIFKQDGQVESGICVFWKQMYNEAGNWSTEGCTTSQNGTDFICSCDHLSFFAVLVNPKLSVDKAHSRNLSYITYIGSALSVFFTVISFIIYICLQSRRPEKAISLHMHLTGALFCLHLSFLLCSFWVWMLKDKEEDGVCRILGLVLHWSLLATLSWTALEGFHLYLLLIRVFNIYVRRYLLKLSLVGWGLPTVTAVICAIFGVYGKHSLKLKDAENQDSGSQICWISSQFQHGPVVSYITTMAFPCLVVVCNSCMLGLVVYKLQAIRRPLQYSESSSGCKKIEKEKRIRLWKDCAMVLGLSCVLGLAWGLATTTYISLPGIYIFTVLNSLQGLFMFLWSMALVCKSQSDNNSSIRDRSSQNVMMTSFNN
ncbi:adhesion G protein-coupled receptor G3-like [Echeneis naucrates]|uniref:adhesion G protein-coupled receptor G3-like n=1 Tax=Echeneis naucrates TaxID=173247 RepID=UPI0011134001|nr:adhesion G protein-coupled receptor G3-like [Echeneis naucrates]